MELKEQKLNEIRNELEELLLSLDTKSSKGSKLHEVERHIFSQLLQLGMQILGYYILLVAQLVAASGTPTDSLGNKMRNTGKKKRSYFSLFGMLEINRFKYYSPVGRTHYELDQRLGLPVGRYSYVLSDWLAYGAVELDFAQSVNQLERILGHSLSGMQSSRQTYHLSEQVEAFYQQQDWQSTEDGSHLSIGYDGKGIPIIRSQTDRKQDSTAVRLAKGQKKGVRREATISVSSSFNPRVRDKEELLSNLFLTKDEGIPPEVDPGQVAHSWHDQKHIRAFLSDKTKAITYGIDNLLKRDQTGKKPIVVLIDGDRALENAVRQVCQEKQIEHRIDAYVLDFIHLLKYVWKVANAYLGENSEAREAWVYRQAGLFLESRHEAVLDEWKQIKDGHRLSKNGLYNLERAITYVSNRPHMLDYKTYLAKGYPITTGAVESACGHFIKSRMDRAAMHWGKAGAQKNARYESN